MHLASSWQLLRPAHAFTPAAAGTSYGVPVSPPSWPCLARLPPAVYSLANSLASLVRLMPVNHSCTPHAICQDTLACTGPLHLHGTSSTTAEQYQDCKGHSCVHHVACCRFGASIDSQLSAVMEDGPGSVAALTILYLEVGATPLIQ